MLDDKAVSLLKQISLSNDTIQRRVHEMAKNVENQLIRRLHESKYFSIQLDESLDISNCAILVCYVRYIGETDVEEDVLCCLNLPGKVTGETMFCALK